MAKRRLIDLVLDRDLSIDRDQARRLILTGSVQVNGHIMVQPAAYVGVDVEVRLKNSETSVSRAGQKLSFALSQWNIPVEEKITADVGAAAGGFTEGLLRHGARRVYAIETGKGQLAWKIRQDKRVVVMEETNILQLHTLPDPIDLATIDVSWTPLRQALPALAPLLGEPSTVIALLKPNYELQQPGQLVNGVLVDPQIRTQVIQNFMLWAENHDWQVLDETRSPVTGDRGNVEWLFHLRYNVK